MPRRGCASRALAWACCRFRRRSPAVHVPWRGGDGRAFGRVAADHAVPVLVAAAPPRAVRVGEIRGHARFVAQLGVPGELGAVVMRHSGAGGGRQPGEHGLLRRHARGGGLVGHDCGHGETGAPPDLGVQAAARADDAVGLPLAETVPVVPPVGAFADRRAQRDATAARTPAWPRRRMSTGGRPPGGSASRGHRDAPWRGARISAAATGPGATAPRPTPAGGPTPGAAVYAQPPCGAWPCGARARPRGSGPSTDPSWAAWAGTAGTIRSRWTGTTCRV